MTTSPHGHLRLNVGCGSTPTPGWLNFDNSLSVRLARYPSALKCLLHLGCITASQLEFANTARDAEVVWADVTRRIPLPNESAEAIYSCHMLEHLDRAAARSFLGEAARVLAAGGILRIAVPDLQRLAQSYIEGAQSADQFVSSLLMSRESPRDWRSRLKHTMIGFRDHRWMYDAHSLANLLERCGFSDITEVPPGKTTIPSPGFLNLHEREPDSIYVEAKRT